MQMSKWVRQTLSDDFDATVAKAVGLLRESQEMRNTMRQTGAPEFMFVDGEALPDVLERKANALLDHAEDLAKKLEAGMK